MTTKKKTVLQDATPPEPVAAAPTKRPRGRPKLAPGESKAKSKAQYNADFRAKGRPLHVVMTDPAALAVLDAETAKGRTLVEVLAWALIEAAKSGRG